MSEHGPPGGIVGDQPELPNYPWTSDEWQQWNTEWQKWYVRKQLAERKKIADESTGAFSTDPGWDEG